MFLSSEWRWQNKNTVVGIWHTRQAAFCSGAVRKYPTEMAQNFQQETSKAGCYPGNKSGPRGRGLRMRIMLLETDLAAPYRHRVQNSEEVSAPKGTEVALERPLGRRSWAEVELWKFQSSTDRCQQLLLSVRSLGWGGSSSDSVSGTSKLIFMEFSRKPLNCSFLLLLVHTECLGSVGRYQYWFVFPVCTCTELWSAHCFKKLTNFL